MNSKEKANAIKAGQIASQVKAFAKSIIKKDVPLLEIANKIDEKILELGGKPAFPVNLSIDDIAAHYTPSHNDETLASGLLKIDLGVHVDGIVADTAFSIDLENSEKNQKLIQIAEQSLENAIEKIKEKKSKITLGEIGEIIETTIQENDLTPICNLSGHSMEKYDLHAGQTIPNINNGSAEKLGEGVKAIEPFTTLSSGSGKVYEGKPSGIYMLINSKQIRSPLARKILDYVLEEYETLPFCSREIVQKFGTSSLFALKQLEQSENLHQFPQLIEASHKPVAQAENTIIIDKDEVIVTSE